MCFELLTRMLENKPPSSLSQLTLSLHLNLTCWCVFSFCFLKTHQGLQKPSKCCLIGLWGRGGHRLSGKERIMNYYWDFIFLILWKLWMKEQVAALCWVLGRHDRWGNECRKGREVKDRVRQAIHGKWGGARQYSQYHQLVLWLGNWSALWTVEWVALSWDHLLGAEKARPMAHAVSEGIPPTWFLKFPQ